MDPPDKRGRKKLGIALATGGLLLALAGAIGLRWAGLVEFGTRQWIISLVITLAVQGGLWLIADRRWDEKLRGDPHYLYLPMIAVALLFSVYTYGAPSTRAFILMFWLVALLFLVGRAGLVAVAILSTVMTAGYLGALAARKAEGMAIPMPEEIIAGAAFLIICLYAGFVLERLRRRQEKSRTLQVLLSDLAATDALTGLPNRRLFEESLRAELARIRRYGGRCSVAMIDVDYFKNYNDRLGHLAGDVVLREIASLIRQSLRTGDGAARFGGEEFSLVMTSTGKRGGIEVVDRLRSLVASYPFEGRERQPAGCVTISAGIATCPEDGREYEDLIRRADEALYIAKSGGRNRVEVA